MAAHSYDGSAASGPLVVNRGGSDRVATQRRRDGGGNASDEHLAAAGERRLSAFPATAGNTTALGQCLSPGVDDDPGGAPQSASPPAGALRAGAVAANPPWQHTERDS